MVLYSDLAVNDLEDILYGLMTWEKHPLSFDHAKKYVRELRNIADNLDSKSFHLDCSTVNFRFYGLNYFIYKRNHNTLWYFIYNWDKENNIIYINKITNNQLITT